MKMGKVLSVSMSLASRSSSKFRVCELVCASTFEQGRVFLKNWFKMTLCLGGGTGMK